MSVYGGRSTVSDDVKKWSNECDAAIKLWAGKLLILMSEMLHLMPMPSDALAIECDVRTAAPDRETIRCTLTVVCWWNCQSCIWCRCHQMHWRLSVSKRCVASNSIAIRWKTVDARIPAPDRDEIRCIGGVVWLSDCCIRSWNDQMHADDCL